MPKHQIGELIDDAKARGLTLRDIVERTGGNLAQGTISGWKGAETVNIQSESIVEFANAIEVPPVIVFLAAIGELHKVERKDKPLKEVLDGLSDLQRQIEKQGELIETLRQRVQERLSLGK